MPHKDDLRQIIIEPLIAQRERFGLTQNDLDEIIGVTRGQIGKWECGDRTPGLFLLKCWMDALCCKIVTVVEEDKCINIKYRRRKKEPPQMDLFLTPKMK